MFRVAWARDEPPSPTHPENHDFLSAPSHESLRRPSDVASYQSSDPGPSRWWTFTLPRPQRTSTFDKDTLGEVKHDLRGNLLKDRLNSKRTGSVDTTTVGNSEPKENAQGGWGASPRIDFPRMPGRPLTLSRTQTPGWDTPWFPTSVTHANGNGDAYNDELAMEEQQPKEDDKQTPWKQRKKMLRGFLLTNSYVPLVSAPL